MKKKEIIQEKNLIQVILEKSGLKDLVRINFMNASKNEVYWMKPGVVYKKGGMDQITLNLEKTTISAHKYKVVANFTEQHLNDLKGYGIDAKQQTDEVLITEAAQIMLKLFLNKMNKLANISYLNTYTKWDKFKSWLWNILGKDYKKTTKVKDVNNLIQLITYHSAKIYSKTRMSPAKFIICNSATASILANSSSYVWAKSSIHETFSPLYLVGYIGNMKIFVNNQMSQFDNAIYMGAISEENGVGLRLFVYDNGTIRGSFENEDKITSELYFRCALEKIGNNPEQYFMKFNYKMK